MNNAPNIEIGNLILRLPIEADKISRINLGYDIECEKMCGREENLKETYEISDAVLWYDKILGHPCKWIIEYKGKMIGIAGLTPYVEDNKGRFFIEIYDGSSRGKGIGKDVINLVLKYAFEELKYHKVYLRVLDTNVIAIKCYESCGFKREGIDREGAYINGRYLSDIYMGILISEYFTINSK